MLITMMEKPEMEDAHISITYQNISSQVLELLHYELMFTLEQRRQGAVIIHFLVCLYAFAALAILCDDYFCASLSKICKRLDIHPDVAGATFMAAGSSMPTMFISVTSVFLDEGDIGLGTIIGSTMFNILFVTGICGVGTSVTLNLKPYSIIRDSLCYVIYLIVLLIAMCDGMIYWYEALAVSSLYGFYVLVMYHNSTLEHHFNAWARVRFHQTRYGSPARSPPKSPARSPSKSPAKSPVKSPSKSPPKSLERTPVKLPLKSPVKSPSNSPARSPSKSPPKSPGRTPVSSPLRGAPNLPDETPVSPPALTIDPLQVSDDNVDYDDELNLSDQRSVYSDTDSSIPHTKYDDEPIDSLGYPSGRWERLRWTVMFPIRVLYYITIPDCRLASWENWYVVTFVMSIAWMGVHSYVLVWAVSVIGVTISIPECIMGLTLLAAGSSVPDAISSLVMTKQGMGDMALANAIGSNIFDMLCLSIPWLLSTTVVHSNSVVMIHGGNIVYVSMTLFGTVAAMLFILYHNKWQLNRRLGCAMLTAYVFFLSTAVVIEAFPHDKGGKHPRHRPDLPHKGLGVHHKTKNRIKTTGFTWF